jgi:hypothetical protein
MKMIFSIMFGIMCINFSILILGAYPTILPGTSFLTPMNSTQIANATDLDSIRAAGSTSGTLTIFNYIKEAIGLFARIGDTIIFGLPDLMMELGVPTAISTAVYGLTLLLWALFFVELFAGRDVMD